MEKKWYFANFKGMKVNTNYQDPLLTSRFKMDDEEQEWQSFGRELIQNSLDAQYDFSKPVIVDFELKKDLTLTDIPGGAVLKEVLTACTITPHEQTAVRYRKGLEILSKKKVFCLKVSDRNTHGVRRDLIKNGKKVDAWKGLLEENGSSFKFSDSSGGSHGVGKAAAFLLSTCNTVFYATKNRDEEEKTLMQGKTMLVNWKDKNRDLRSDNGWYGVVDNNLPDEEKIRPLRDNELRDINPFFVRESEYGTDIIIVGVNIYDAEQEKGMKEAFIKVILENFFVAIINKNLVVNVFGQKIDYSNIKSFLENHNIVSGFRKNIDTPLCMKIYQPEKPNEVLPIVVKKKNYGNVKMYITLGGQFGKKAYCIARKQGMKTAEYSVLSAGQPFTAIAVMDGEELNAHLLKLENPSHDKYLQKNNKDMTLEDLAKYDLSLKILDKVREEIKNFVLRFTKVEPKGEQPITGMDDIFEIPETFSSEITKGNKKPNPRPNPKPPSPNPNDGYFIFNNYQMNPVFIKGDSDNSYFVKFRVNDTIKNARVTIRSVNSDGKEDTSIVDFIKKFYDNDGQEQVITFGVVDGLKIEKDKLMSFKIVLSHEITYRLRLKISYEEGSLDE